MTARKFQKRTRQDGPDTGLPLALAVGGFAVLVTCPVAAHRADWGRWDVVLAVPAALTAGYWLHGRLLLLAAALRLRARGIRAIVVTSSSPKWQDHVRDVWTPRLSAHAVMLDASERPRPRDVAAAVAHRFAGYEGPRGVPLLHAPVVVVLRGLRHPLVFKFEGAFQRAKHGDRRQLEELERQLFSSLRP
jgi:hypothetical protein